MTMNAAGAEDELTLVCKQILMLVETNGYRFDEIGVVGRTLAPYQGTLKKIFDQHRIPFSSTASLPLLQQPLVKTLCEAAHLKLNGQYRAGVLEVVASPWYRASPRDDIKTEPRPDQWRVAVAALGITRGDEEWKRLGRRSHLESWRSDGDDSEIERSLPLSVDPAQLRLLWGRVEGLLADVAALPEEGGYGQLTEAYRAFVTRHLRIPDIALVTEAAAGAAAEEYEVGQALAAVFAQLHDLDRLDVTVRWDEWVRTFVDLLERSATPIAPAEFAAVEVLDAMAARGMSFRALFIIGLNEKLFPRYIHEDGFLRDRHRFVLNETLGFKLDQKLQGYAEEALLFELLRSSAQERLYLSYQRVDTDARALAPSAYLDEAHVPGLKWNGEPNLALPRRWEERARIPLFAPPMLTPEELTVAMVLEGHDVSALLTAAGREGNLFGHGAAAQAKLEGDHHRLGPYDGLLDGSTTHWAGLMERGLSPTALETYACCPFRYFSERLLRVESVRQLPSPEIPPPAMGLLCHESLRRCFVELLGRGWPLAAVQEDELRGAVVQAVDRAFEDYAADHGTGYALTWRLARERVVRAVTAVVHCEQEEGRAAGALPVAFEVEAAGRLPPDEGGVEVPIRGRWDRVDRMGEGKSLRVIDYKYKPGSEVRAEDRNLLQAALRAKRLQPAFYSLMTTSALPGGTAAHLPDEVVFVYLLPQGDPTVERARFLRTAWTSPPGDQLRKNIQTLIEGIRSEQFFILPDGYCTHCDYAVACRRAHQPTWWRSYRSPEAKALRSLRRTSLSRE
jgi:ATP-dependent helicase/nuclease subunit B